jgi:hypothetical protein
MIISRKSWHYQLQQYVLGNIPNYSGLCPYFWMTLACMLFLVPVSIKRKLYDPLVRLKRKLDENMFRKYLLRMDEEALYSYYKRIPRWQFEDAFWILIQEGKYQRNDLLTFLEKFTNRKWEEIQSSEKAEARFLEIVEKTSKIIKQIGRLSGYVFLTAASLLLIGAIVILFYEIHTKGQWMTALFVLAIILCTIITFGVGYIIYDNVRYSDGYESSKRKLVSLVTTPFKFIYKKIKATVDFIFDNYCPRIELQD